MKNTSIVKNTPTLGKGEQIVAKVIIDAMVKNLKDVLNWYGPGGVVGSYMTNKAPALLGTEVILPIVGENYSTNEILRMMLDQNLQTAIDKFQTELALLPLGEQVEKLNYFVKVDWDAIFNSDKNDSINGLDSVFGFFHRTSQERAVAKLGLTELKFMLQHLPYLQQVLQLASVYASVAVEAERLFCKEKYWLNNVSAVDNSRIVSRLVQIRDEFSVFENMRVSSVRELSILLPKLRELVSLTEQVASSDDRSIAMALRVETASLLSKKLEENGISTLEAQQKQTEETLLQFRLIQTSATRTAHIKKAVELLSLTGRSKFAFETILTFVHLTIQNSSTAVVTTVQRVFDNTNRKALEAILTTGLNSYEELMREVNELTKADIEQYIPKKEDNLPISAVSQKVDIAKYLSEPIEVTV